MAKPKKDDEAKVWTNVSANPVILADGSTVAPGEATTEAQASLVPGSCWEEWRVLVPGSAEQSFAADQQIDELRQENAQLRQQLADGVTAAATAAAEHGEAVTKLNQEIEALKAQIKPAE
ncbi:MAG TPA: hypothetical protein DCP84_16650 [Pseudomonas sp.]|nr:hypothetical protein [Pseudomonas sp.]